MPWTRSKASPRRTGKRLIRSQTCTHVLFQPIFDADRLSRLCEPALQAPHVARSRQQAHAVSLDGPGSPQIATSDFTYDNDFGTLTTVTGPPSP